ncbi:MAG TPA: CoA-transferase [Candidatus Deferrimicrobium sp.]|nr:CoA-transferase [Candidatus Deferrimicrobium sp.]
MNIITEGIGELFQKVTPNEFREWTRENKSRMLIDKRMTEKEAVSRFVKNGNYLAIGGFGHVRIPMAVIYEIVRQRIKDLSVAGHTAVHDLDTLIAGGCVKNVDAAYITGYEVRGLSAVQRRAYESGSVKLTEWSNGTLAWRLKAAAIGVSFLPVRCLLGTDTMKYSAAKVARCPFTNDIYALVPALFPDVTIVHVHRCDIYGNAQIDGAVVKDDLSARAAKRVIMTTEEIIDTEQIREQPWNTIIPYYNVDAVIEVPWGSHPGNMPLRYFYDNDFINKYLEAGKNPQELAKFLDEWIYSLEDFDEYLTKLGFKRLRRLRDEEFMRRKDDA